MFARHITTQVRKDKLDEALKIYEESVIPEGKNQQGYRGIYLLTNKESGRIVSISLWDTERDALSNEDESYLEKQIAKFNGMLLSPPVKEEFDVTIMLAKPK